MSCAAKRFGDLMAQVQAGSEEAAWQLVEEYGETIRRTVRAALNPRIRKSFDSLDFVQLVWSSLFKRKENLNRFAEPSELAAFLMVMARNKVCSEMRKSLFTKKRNAGREESLDEASANSARQMVGREPSPSDIAEARERWQQLMANQPPHYQQIIELRLQGYGIVEIAERLHLARSTVHRFLDRLFNSVID